MKQTHESIYADDLMNWSHTYAFHKTTRTTISMDDPIATTAITFLDFPIKESKIENSFEIRGLALKIIEKLEFKTAVPDTLIQRLCEIGRTDGPINVILATKAVESINKKVGLSDENINKFLHLVCKSSIAMLEKMKVEAVIDVLLVIDQLYFVFNFAKSIRREMHPSIIEVTKYIEMIALSLISNQYHRKSEVTHVNSILLKFLGFIFDGAFENPILERLIMYLLHNINDESKELSFNLISKVGQLAERNIFILKNRFDFFLNSKFIDVKAYGIKQLLKILKHKTGFTKLLETIQVCIITAAKQLFITHFDFSTLLSLLESLSQVNKLYLEEDINEKRKQDFVRVSMRVCLSVFKNTDIYLNVDSNGYVISTIIGEIENFVALLNLKDSKEKIEYIDLKAKLNMKNIDAENCIILEQFFKFSFNIFTNPSLKPLLQRFYKIYFYTDSFFVEYLMSEYISSIYKSTSDHNPYHLVWDIYLTEETSSVYFMTQMYSYIISIIENESNESMYIGKKEVENMALSNLEYLFKKHNLNASQFEKILLTNKKILMLDGMFPTLKVLFNSFSVHYGSFTIIPKLIYENLESFYRVLKEKYIVERDELYIYLALNVPVSISLVLRYYNSLIYFLTKGLEIDSLINNTMEILSASINLDWAITDTTLVDNLIKNIMRLAEGGEYSMAATEILARLPARLKKYLHQPELVLNSYLPDAKVYLKTGKIKFNGDFVLNRASNIINVNGGYGTSFIKLKGYISSFQKHYRRNSNNVCSAESRALIMCFLNDILLFNRFENVEFVENICTWTENNEGNKLNLDGYKKQNNGKNITIRNKNSTNFENIHINFYGKLSNVRNNINAYENYALSNIVHDCILSLFVVEEMEYLNIAYKVAIILNIKRSSPVIVGFFNIYNCLLDCLVEAFGFGEINDRNVNVLMISRLFSCQILLHVSEFLEAADYPNDIKFEFFDGILNRLLCICYSNNQQKQNSVIIGLASLVVVLKDKKKWLYYNLPTITKALISCISKNNPILKNTIYVTFSYIFELLKTNSRTEFPYLFYSTELQTKSHVSFKGEFSVVNMLLESLSSKYSDLRVLSRSLLHVYSNIFQIPLDSIYVSYFNHFYSSISSRDINYILETQLGFLDTIVFYPPKTCDSNLSVLINVCLTQDYKSQLSKEAIVLKLRGYFFLLNVNKSNEMLLRALEFISNNLVAEIYNDNILVDYISKSIAEFEASEVAINFTENLIKKHFNNLFHDKINTSKNLDICLAISKTFKLNFSDEMINICMDLLKNQNNDVSNKAISLLAYCNKLSEQQLTTILDFISFYYGLIKQEHINLFIKHKSMLNNILTRINNPNILRFLFELIKHDYIRNHYCYKAKDIYNKIKTDTCNYINVFVFLSKLDYKFTEDDISSFISCYEPIYYLEYSAFITRVANILTANHINAIYTTIPNIIFDKYVIDILVSQFISKAGIMNMVSPLSRYNLTKNWYYYIETQAPILIREDYVFEYAFKNRLMYTDLIRKIDLSSISFTELCYYALCDPHPNFIKSIIIFSDTTSRIINILLQIKLNTDKYNYDEMLLELFDSNVSYRIQLMILFPFLIEFPFLITKTILPKIIDSIYRLFNTGINKHRILGSKLLLSASINFKSHHDIRNLFTFYFYFVISLEEPELKNLFSKFELDLNDSLELDDSLNTISLCNYLVSMIRTGRSKKCYKQILGFLITRKMEYYKEFVPLLFLYYNNVIVDVILDFVNYWKNIKNGESNVVFEDINKKITVESDIKDKTRNAEKDINAKEELERSSTLALEHNNFSDESTIIKRNNTIRNQKIAENEINKNQIINNFDEDIKEDVKKERTIFNLKADTMKKIDIKRVHCFVKYLFDNKITIIDENVVIDCIDGLVNTFVSDPTGFSYIKIEELLSLYPYSKKDEYYKFLCSITYIYDNPIVYEQLINILESNEINSIDGINLEGKTESFYNFLIYVLRNKKYEFLHSRLSGSIWRGLSCDYRYIRDELHEIVNESLPRNINKRIETMLSMDWTQTKLYSFLWLLIDDCKFVENFSIKKEGGKQKPKKDVESKIIKNDGIKLSGNKIVPEMDKNVVNTIAIVKREETKSIVNKKNRNTSRKDKSKNINMDGLKNIRKVGIKTNEEEKDVSAKKESGVILSFEAEPTPINKNKTDSLESIEINEINLEVKDVFLKLCNKMKTVKTNVLRENLLNICYHDNTITEKLIVSFFKAYVTAGNTVSESIFRGFCYNLINKGEYSYFELIGNLIGVFNFVLLDIRNITNSYFNNYSSLPNRGRSIIYKKTGYIDLYMHSFDSINVYADDFIFYLTINEYEKASNILMNAMLSIDDSNDIDEAEFVKFLFMRLLAETGQYDNLIELANVVKDHEMATLSLFNSKKQGTELANSILCMEDSISKIFYGVIYGNVVCTNAIKLSQSVISTSPNYTYLYTDTLNKTQALLEINDSRNIRSVIDGKFKKYKVVCGINNEYYIGEPLVDWLFYATYRELVLNETENVDYKFNTVTKYAINANNYKMAEFLNQRIHSNKSKVIENYNRAILELSLHTRRNELSKMVVKARSINLTNLNNEQRATIYGYIAKENNDYATAIAIYPKHSRNWYDWGVFLDKNDHKTNSFTAFLMACIFENDCKIYFIKVIKYLKENSSKGSAKIFKEHQNKLNYKSLTGFMEYFIENVESEEIQMCLSRMAILVPITLLRHVMLYIDEMDKSNGKLKNKVNGRSDLNYEKGKDGDINLKNNEDEELKRIKINKAACSGDFGNEEGKRNKIIEVENERKNKNKKPVKKEKTKSIIINKIKDTMTLEKQFLVEKGLDKKEILKNLLFNLKYKNCRSNFGFLMIKSICIGKLRNTPEESTLLVLETFFNVVVSKIDVGFDASLFVNRIVSVMNKSAWRDSLLKQLISDFKGCKTNIDYLVTIYIWLKIVENFLNSNSSPFPSLSRLSSNLSIYEIPMFGEDELISTTVIDYFEAVPVLRISNGRINRSFSIIGSDGKENVYIATTSGTKICNFQKKITFLASQFNLEFLNDYSRHTLKFNIVEPFQLHNSLVFVPISEPVLTLTDLFEGSFNYKRLVLDYLILLDKFGGNINGIDSVLKIVKNEFKSSLNVGNVIDNNYVDGVRNNVVINKQGSNSMADELEINIDIPFNEDLADDEFYDYQNQIYDLQNDNYENGVATEGINDINREGKDYPADESGQKTQKINKNMKFTQEMKKKAFIKIYEKIGNKVLVNRLQSIYGDSQSYFLFKIKSLKSYATAGAFYYGMGIQQSTTNKWGFNLYSADTVFLELMPFLMKEYSLRLTPNLVNIYKEEGVSGIYVPTAYKICEHMINCEYFDDYVNVFFDVKNFKRNNFVELKNGIRQKVNEATSLEILSNVDLLFMPWL